MIYSNLKHYWCTLYNLLRTKLSKNGMWQPKSLTNWGLDSKSHWKIEVKVVNPRLIQLVWIVSQRLIMGLSCVYGPCVPKCTQDNVWEYSPCIDEWCTYIFVEGILADRFVQSDIFSHSYTDGSGCHARCWPAHLEEFGVQYLAQGHFDM